MKLTWTLRCKLEDGRIAEAPVDLEINPKLLKVTTLTEQDLVKHRLLDAYLVTLDLVDPDRHMAPPGSPPI